MKACFNCEGGDNGDCYDPNKNPALKREIRAAKMDQVPENYVQRVIQFARQGYKDLQFKTYDTDWDSEAYLTVSGQNSNNSVSIKDDFLRAVENDGEWHLTARKDGRVMKTLKARDLWETISYAAWASADPGIHFNTTMNDWHTSPAGGPIRGSNPCSEYMMLRWYQGGRKVCSATSQRGGKITKSTFAVPASSVGAVRTEKIDGSG